MDVDLAALAKATNASDDGSADNDSGLAIPSEGSASINGISDLSFATRDRLQWRSARPVTVNVHHCQRPGRDAVNDVTITVTKSMIATEAAFVTPVGAVTMAPSRCGLSMSMMSTATMTFALNRASPGNRLRAGDHDGSRRPSAPPHLCSAAISRTGLLATPGCDREVTL